MTRRQRGYASTRTTIRDLPGTPPTGPAGASTANRPSLPVGPALVYIAPDGTTTPIDDTAVTGPRDRALCRALLGRASTVLDQAEEQQGKNPVGFTGPTTTTKEN